MLSRGRSRLTGLVSLAFALALPATASAAFPGANGRIAFDGDGPSGMTTNVLTMNPDGTGKANLTGSGSSSVRGTASGSYAPAYSADGERIVYENVEQGVFRPDIWVMNADGSGKTNLTQNTGSDRETDPGFSPDGSRIVYLREPDGGDSSIYVMNADGSAPTDLTSALPITSPSSPEFSPDGSKIAFDAIAGPDTDVYVMNANGTGLTNITSAVSGSSTDPSWSPDGARIAFAHRDPMTTRNDIFVIGSSGGATTNLTSALPVTTQSDNPAFSPDGTRIAYRRSEPSADSEIFTMGSTDGLGQTNLTTDLSGSGSRPNWGPIDADAPTTTISKGPKRKSSKPTAKIEFAADEAGVSFECKLKGKGVAKRFRKFKGCTSPRTYRRLKPGKKKFQVRAIDPAGNVGPAAKLSWKVTEGK